MESKLEEVLEKQTGILEVLATNLKPNPWVTLLAVAMIVQILFTFAVIYHAIKVQRVLTVLDVEILQEE